MSTIYLLYILVGVEVSKLSLPPMLAYDMCVTGDKLIIPDCNGKWIKYYKLNSQATVSADSYI